MLNLNPCINRWLIGTFVLPVLCAALGATARAQVNTESMRRDNQKPGWHNQITVGVTYEAGNNSYISLSGGYRLDLVDPDFYTFLVANYQRGSSNEELYRNDGFAHIRFILTLDSTFKPEVFAQKEFNDFILLRDRNLAGAGLRCTLIDHADTVGGVRLHVGVGGMVEQEEIADTAQPRTLLGRSTNYVSFDWDINNIGHLGLAAYYQIAPSRPDDYRILAEAQLSARITSVVSLVVNSRYRFDNLPPVGIRKFDFKISNGLAVSF